jgi:hypothetical protein
MEEKEEKGKEKRKRTKIIGTKKGDVGAGKGCRSGYIRSAGQPNF